MYIGTNPTLDLLDNTRRHCKMKIGVTVHETNPSFLNHRCTKIGLWKQPDKGRCISQ